MAGWAWSERVEQAAWIAASLPAGPFACAVPPGYEAYARLLHPIEVRDPEGAVLGQVRWAEVAAWSGQPLGPQTRFWQIALPEHLPAGPMPGDGAPASDVLGARDGAALAEVLRGHTAAPEQCWFGIWDGYGWDSATGDPVPPGVRHGPRVRLPGRDYLLYTGPVEAGLAFLPGERELADLWWPHDRAWFVYGDVDLNCTYVGGSAALIDALLAASGLEAVPVGLPAPGDSREELPAWLASRVQAAVRGLLDTGHAVLRTSRFTVRFDLERTRPVRYRESGARRVWSRGPGLETWLRYSCDGKSRASGGSVLSGGETRPEKLRREVIQTLIGLVEG